MPEWISHLKALGVEHLFVYASDLWEGNAALDREIEAGFASIHYVPEVRSFAKCQSVKASKISDIFTFEDKQMDYALAVPRL